MRRRPFDPKQAEGAQANLFEAFAPPAASEDSQEPAAVPETPAPRELSVGQLANLIRQRLEAIPGPIVVVGEVSNLSTRHHWYFSLKDEDALVGCVAWASTARRFSYQPRDGDRVLVSGTLSYYPPSGRTQLYVQSLRPIGQGDLERRFRQMCDELRQLGYFDDSRKKPLPLFPRRIAIVTSRKAAALQDVISTAAQRCKAVSLLLVDVRVQGEFASREVAAAVGWVDRYREMLGVDAILVTRGGGSMEDLWAFNERIVAEAVHQCTLPLVAAIGHESDTTVIELVADVRAATPTQAVMRLIPAAEELHQQVDHLEHRLHSLILGRLQRERERLETIGRHPLLRDPMAMVRLQHERMSRLSGHLLAVIRERVGRDGRTFERLVNRWHQSMGAIHQQRHQRLALLEDRLGRACRMRHGSLSQQLQSLAQRLAAVDPLAVLGRGYSYTTTSSGELVRSKDQAPPGTRIITHLANDRLNSEVQANDSEDDGPGLIADA